MSIAWNEAAGRIFLPVVTFGLTGSEWLLRLRRQGYVVDEELERILVPQGKEERSQFGQHTGPALAREAVIVKNFSGSRTELLELKQAQKWRFAPPEVACYLRETLSDEDLKAMGLQWLSVEMQKPFCYWYRYSEKPTFEQNLLPCVHRNGAFTDNGQKTTGGRHLGVSYTTGSIDHTHGHLFLC
ncbi:MAG: hypothetical protein RLZZ480_661 [Candidatus Parcubacteria bacterium]|jgi:hypothetical protein